MKMMIVAALLVGCSSASRKEFTVEKPGIGKLVTVREPGRWRWYQKPKVVVGELLKTIVEMGEHSAECQRIAEKCTGDLEAIALRVKAEEKKAAQ